MKRNSILAVVAGAAALGLGSLGSAMADDIPIGVIANLTGQDVNTSVQMVRGVQIAADEINKAGGVNGKTIKLIVEDSEYKTQEALTAATKLYEVDKVPAAIMFGGSSLMIAVAELAKQDGKVLLNTSSSSAKLGDYPGTLFSILPLDDIVGKALGEYVAKKGVKSVATIVPNNTFGLGVANAAGEAFKAAGGKVVKSVAYTEGQPDYRADVQSVVAAAPEAIISAGYGDDFANDLQERARAWLQRALVHGVSVDLHGRERKVDERQAVGRRQRRLWRQRRQGGARGLQGEMAERRRAPRPHLLRLRRDEGPCRSHEKGGRGPEGDRRRAARRRERLCRRHRLDRVG